jgi:hypothetical protein
MGLLFQSMIDDDDGDDMIWSIGGIMIGTKSS